MTADDHHTHFGYRTVASAEKAGLVKGVFDAVAHRYDLMNDLMSGGLHRLWKHFALEQAAVRPGQTVLDLAGGTGDLAAKFAQDTGAGGQVVLADINAAMLKQGRRRLVDRGIVNNLSLAQVDAEQLPFAAHSFDCVAIAFGLRNVTDTDRALRSMYRVLKPGGKLLILEFSQPAKAIQGAYDLYSFHVLPTLGRWVAGNEDSYRYLAESIRRHPDQDSLRAMMQDAGFERCRYYNLTAGIVALHLGYRI